ncbi:hypothetical protein BR93DRAFT_390508 [Coniochaeta sp. PMI_546]|nr:hypothetical protein BR93DRAFT_390508 [Coniochaeta sp. PMI_546]
MHALYPSQKGVYANAHAKSQGKPLPSTLHRKGPITHTGLKFDRPCSFATRGTPTWRLWPHFHLLGARRNKTISFCKACQQVVSRETSQAKVSFPFDWLNRRLIYPPRSFNSNGLDLLFSFLFYAFLVKTVRSTHFDRWQCRRLDDLGLDRSQVFLRRPPSLPSSLDANVYGPSDKCHLCVLTRLILPAILICIRLASSP